MFYLCRMRFDAAKNLRRAPKGPMDVPTLVLTSGGLGFLRPAPGTWGSMPPPALAAAALLAGAGPLWVALGVAGVLLASCAACVALGERAEQRFGAKDAAEVVIDETAGVCLPVLASLALPGLTSADQTERGLWIIGAMGASFLLFRVLDIVKPWPARRLERLRAGWGVLADDLAAGAYAAAPLLLMWWLARA